MKTNRRSTVPAPVCQLQGPGTEKTYKVLEAAMKSLPDEEVDELAGELEFFERTGLVGIRMSRLIVNLRANDMHHVA